MSLPLARKKSFATLRRETLKFNFITPSQKTEGKSAFYKDVFYADWLEGYKSFLTKWDQGVAVKSKKKS